MPVKSLVNLLAAELSKKIPVENTLIEKSQNRTAVRNVSTTIPKTILQLNATPFAIDVNEYRNPHSGDNPTGDYKAAYKLKLLADAIPLVATDYVDSLQSTEKVWGNIVNYANADVPYTQNLLNLSREKFANCKLASMGGSPDDWWPVYAQPANWYDIVQNAANLVPLELDITDPDVSDADYVTVASTDESLVWKVSDNSSEKGLLLNMNTSSRIKKITIHVLRVDFIRPWMNFELLNLKNWKIDGLDKGYYSSGSLDNNEGVFPLVITSMLVGSRIAIEGKFNKEDMTMLEQSKAVNNTLSIGTFLMSNDEQPVEITGSATDSVQLISNIRQIIGYISNLVPVAPGI